MPRVVRLRKPQRAILESLRDSNRPLTRKQIATRSKVDPTKVGDYAGPRPIDQSEETKSRWDFPALDALGYIRVEQHDVDGRDVLLYTITLTGLKYLENN